MIESVTFSFAWLVESVRTKDTSIELVTSRVADDGVREVRRKAPQAGHAAAELFGTSERCDNLCFACVQSSDQTADARAADHVYWNSPFLEGLEEADMCTASGSTSAQDQTDGLAT